MDVYREIAFYAKQSELLGSILRVLAIMITAIMAVGAIFGAVNTMYAAVASRTPEIAVLLTLGFRPRSILASFLAESAVIALIGGVIGCLLALPMNGIVTSTTNWANFSEIAFSFRITPMLLLAGVIFAVVMGTLGGFFPARRASQAAGGAGDPLTPSGHWPSASRTAILTRLPTDIRTPRPIRNERS